MPLLVVSGYPSSGKTTLSERVKTYFEERSINVVIVDDDNVTKSVFGNFKKEKECRSSLRSRVQGEFTANTLVICDSLNYIKGFRYELYCVAKQISTTYAVLHCKADKATCKWLNGQRPEQDRYPDEILEDLIRRYERPIANNRWDSPLFEVLIGHPQEEGDSLLDSSAVIFDDFAAEVSQPATFDPSGSEKNHKGNAVLPRDSDIPLENLFTVLIKGESLKPNMATQNLAPKASSTFLHEMDRITQKIITALMEKQRTAVPGDRLVVWDEKARNNQIIFTRQRSLPELTRIRKQFINYTKMHIVEDMNMIPSLFIDFINSNS